MQIKNTGKLLVTSGVMLTLLGCANTADNYEPIVDGPKGRVFQQDLAACQSLAKQRSYVNGDVKTGALIGATLGLLAGSGGDRDDMVGGALGGALIGGGGEALEARDERKDIVVECMRQRGHRVVG